MKNIFALFFVFLLCFTSCKVPKDVTYFQGIDNFDLAQMNAMAQAYSTIICEDDLLTITVTAWDPTVVTPFNPPTFAYSIQGENNVVTPQQLHTYLVDKEGYINFPVVGLVKASGLSKQELSKKLQAEIAKYIKDAMVNIQIVNFKVTLMGEVSRSGTISVRNDRISILDAIGQAGDLTINADRKNILIIRDNNGVPQYGRVDLTDPAIFASPFFYLKQNDVVYVEPNSAKKRNANYSAAQQYNVTVFSTVLSTASLITSSIIAIVSINSRNNNTNSEAK